MIINIGIFVKIHHVYILPNSLFLNILVFPDFILYWRVYMFYRSTCPLIASLALLTEHLFFASEIRFNNNSINSYLIMILSINQCMAKN